MTFKSKDLNEFNAEDKYIENTTTFEGAATASHRHKPEHEVAKRVEAQLPVRG